MAASCGIYFWQENRKHKCHPPRAENTSKLKWKMLSQSGDSHPFYNEKYVIVNVLHISSVMIT